MPKRFPFVCIFVLGLGTIVDANAASTLKVTCTGNLTNTRTDGITLGNCDLNFISVKQMDEIERVCGLFGTVDTPAENQCRIKSLVSPDQISTTDKTTTLWFRAFGSFILLGQKDHQAMLSFPYPRPLIVL